VSGGGKKGRKVECGMVTCPRGRGRKEKSQKGKTRDQRLGVNGREGTGGNKRLSKGERGNRGRLAKTASVKEGRRLEKKEKK